MKRTILLATAATCALTAPALAEEVGKVFSLGEVTASAPAPNSASVGGMTVTQDDVRLFNRDTLDKAMLLVPGTTVSNQGARNETNVWIRGFDRWRVPLYQDGIPIYLPVDNRIDFSRFTTSDIGEIQVSKGWTSVIDGPGAMGGSINLVSRQVTKPLEGDMRIGTSFDQNGALNGFVSDIFTGTRQDSWYLQGAASENYRNHFRLSDSYQPGGYENGGNRDHSYAEDYKVNLKVGYAPNATDEYALNVVNQIGQKDNPPLDAQVPGSQKFWSFPAWDKQSAYFLSKTAIDDKGSYFKTRVYYDRFYNVLDSYDNSAFNTQKTTSAFTSKYDDRAAGGSAEISEMLMGGRDNVRMALHYRWDQHNEWQTLANAATNKSYSQPVETSEQNTYSAALENTFHPAQGWDLVTGISYDYRQMLSADQWAANGATAPYGATIHYPVSDKHALNPQAAVVYHYTNTGSVHTSLSERTRFPTLFEMYSNKFGQATGNPFLRPEKTLYWEGGVADTFGQTHLGANVFWARVRDAIGNVANVTPVNTSHSENIGTELHRGFELDASSQVLDSLEIGGNYSYMLRQNTNGYAVATMTPMHKLFAYANWKPLSGLSVVPSVEVDSKRWFQAQTNSTYTYVRSGDFAVANLKASYDLTSNLQIEAGARNLFDANYQTDWGYHAEGRSYFANARLTF